MMSRSFGQRARASSFRRSLSVACALAFAACSSPPPSMGSSESGVTDEDGLEILFPKMYSAFDGVHEFKVPAVVDGVKRVQWSASDPDMVDLDPQSDGSVLITVRQAGTVTIKAKAGSLAGSADLQITEATAEDWQFGSDRYNNGVTWKRGKDSDGGGGGKRTPDKSLACTNCHANGGADVEHTPMQTAGYSDSDLVMIFSEGRKPAGVEQRIMPAERWNKIHKWSMTADEKKGLITYLRSLEPKSQGPVDFGGRRGGKDKGGKGDGSGNGNGNGNGNGDAGTSQ